ncbi:4-alpha-glucanotransferase [Bacteroidia bacterium]|nr:4-alpha-glucanotransferase [Bacteroidia bacterium]
MKIRFNINFHTIWGQTLYITGSIPELGNWNTAAAKEMDYIEDGNWTLELNLPDKAVNLEYRYFLKSNNKLTFEEWNKNHFLTIIDTQQSYYLLDYWQNRPQNQALYSSAFIKSWFAHPCDKFERVLKSKRKIRLKILAPSIAKNESLAISGNQEEMGNWDPEKALVTACEKFPEWWVDLDSGNIRYPLEYKFCILNNDTKSVVRWETGENRTLILPDLEANETGIVSGLQFRDEQTQWRGAGVAIPVFSLRTQNSFGIGDFEDLHRMIDWVKATHQKIIQILPINDTTMTHTRLDSYPYNAVSIYALHPLYLSLDGVGTLKDPARNAFYHTKQQELNRLPVVDYEEVDRLKWDFFREIFQQEGEEIMTSQAFTVFWEENKDWLLPYAAYSCQRDNYPAPGLYYYIQFHAHQQLTKVRNYARQYGIVLKGDIPIGISRESVEAQTEPGYFNMNFQAGAPPDDFSFKGQNWGFPTYNWNAMEADDYHWWKKRFRKMADYFDAYRIDHILGFFRIWQIPEDSIEGLLGYFSPALPFSIEEIENAGLKFRGEGFTKAHIHEKCLPELFGEYTSEVQQLYLDRIDAEHFALKQKWDTQRKIQAGFAGKEDDKSRMIGAGLFSICNEVLFIEDHEQRGYYHPRISASSASIYQELDHAGQYAFDYLYWNYFYQRNNEFWKKEALKHLTPLVNATDMLVCGEDLGMIPHTVPEVMHKLQILSLEIERMPKSPDREFTDLNRLPYLSVCTTSTHDMTTLRGWWKEDKEKTQRYFNEVLKREGAAPAECTPEISEAIIRNHLTAPSMLTIIPLQDWLAMDAQLRIPDPDAERINIPAHSRHYWRYRMHLTIEELLQAETLNTKIRELIQQSSRNI